ncbi:MAG TPA: hypothetical protein VH519_05960 [Hyphomicrobiaceae bacterium]|jgi:hypothetical protein
MPRITATAAKVTLAFSALVLGTTAASAVSSRVQTACASDFMAYCSQHDPDGPGARKCMRANGPRLSQSCLNALIGAGEVSKAEVARRGGAGK